MFSGFWLCIRGFKSKYKERLFKSKSLTNVISINLINKGLHEGNDSLVTRLNTKQTSCVINIVFSVSYFGYMFIFTLNTKDMISVISCSPQAKLSKASFCDFLKEILFSTSKTNDFCHFLKIWSVWNLYFDANHELPQ